MLRIQTITSNRRRILPHILLAYFLSPPILAQEHKVSTEAIEAIVVTATRRPEAAFLVPVAVNRLSFEEIRASSPQNVMELLRGQSGTYFQQTTPGQGVVVIRGLKGSEVLHLVDGFRLNNAIFRNAPNQYIALVDSQMLDRLEVVRGPMSTLHGGDAMGGVVQMLSVEPHFESDRWSGRGGVRIMYGTADESTLTRVEAAAGHSHLALNGGATYQDVGDRRVGGGDILPYTSYTARAADFKLRTDPATGHEITVSVQYAEQPRTPRHDELTAGFGQTEPTSSVFLFEPQRRDFAQVRWRGSNQTALWDDAEVHIGRQVIEDGRRTRDFGADTQNVEKNRDTTWGATFQAGKALRGDHFVTWGLDFYDDAVDSSRVRTDLVTGSEESVRPRFPDGSTMRQLGVFSVDDWSVNERLDVIAGLRWSSVTTDLPPGAGSVGVSVEESELSGNLGASFAVDDGVRLILNLGRGFRAPNVFDLGTFGDRPGNRFNIPNAGLGAEHVTSLDAGIKVQRDRLQAEVVGYVSRYADKITSVLTGEVTDSGRLVVQNQNAAKLDLVGIEAELRGRPREALELYATTTWTRGDETIGGVETPADRIPPVFGTFGMLWYGHATFPLEAYLVYAGRQDRYSPRDDADPRIRPGGTPGWVTWNARAAWQANRALGLSIRLTNIGDHRYREFGSGVDAPGLGCSLTVDYTF